MTAGTDSAFDATLHYAFLNERLERWFGVYPAVVTDVKDPQGQGQVEVSLPWSPDPGGSAYRTWARLATLMAGAGRGSWFVPEPGDEVLLAFEAGDPRRPCVLGALWNGVDKPPETMDGAGRNNLRVIRSRSGHQIRFDDTAGAETLTVRTPAGQRITLTDSPASVEVVDTNGTSVRLDAAGITLTSRAKVTVNAAAAEVSAATLTVNAGISTFHGVVKADTVIANTVVGTAYTPGAGNIW
ncbi:phage baseplate assembly protein V [Streptomyces sp. NPDC005078]|uniref:phage baseplate assembly protein V n=1 Tax=unclassified Streptomyces TaxID=2593676 RepID=UPI0033ACF200